MYFNCLYVAQFILLLTLAVPKLSTLGTICKAAYLASSRFCLVSGFSPSKIEGIIIFLKKIIIIF